MRTEDLVDMLARQAGPAPRALAARRLGVALLIGGAASIAGTWAFNGFVDASEFATAAAWMKVLYTGALAAVAVLWVARLGQPGASTRGPALSLALIVAGMAAAGLAAVLTAAEGTRLTEVTGQAWTRCPSTVFSLSIPALVGALWALRGLAPARARLAGLAAGVFAGAVGAFAYGLSCTETSPAFVAVWYTAGVALAGALGAALGPRLLRW